VSNEKPGPAFSYTGRERALRHFVASELESGDLEVIREFLDEVLMNKAWDNVGSQVVKAMGQLTTALDAELNYKGSERTQLLAGIPEEVQAVAVDAIELMCGAIDNLLRAKLEGEPYMIHTRPLQEVCIEEIVDRVVEVVHIQRVVSVSISSRVRAAIETLEEPARSYVANIFAREGITRLTSPPGEEAACPETEAEDVHEIAQPGQDDAIEVPTGIPDEEDIPF
jgi:hypothetical protein